MKNTKGFVGLLLTIIMAVVVLAGGAYLVTRPASPPPIFKDQPDTTVNTQSNTNANTMVDETAGWKTYSNAKYGLELKYPNNYQLMEYPSSDDENNRPPGVTISSPSCENMSDREGGLWLEDCAAFNLLIQDNKILIEGVADVKTTTQVSGYTAEKIESDEEGIWEGLNQTHVQFKKDNKWYVSYIAFNKANKTAAENLLDQILSTFKFTSPVSSFENVVLSALVNNPASFLNKKVRITGKLILVGKNYFTDSRFAITDGKNNFSISSWLPLEISMPPPGSSVKVNQSPTMQSYLNKTITLEGTVVKNTQGFYIQVSSAQ